MSPLPVLLVRPAVAADPDAAALRAAGFAVVEDPYLSVTASDDPEALHRAAGALDAIALTADWLLVTSGNAIRALVGLRGEPDVRRALADGQARGLRIACVGGSTAALVAGLGGSAVVEPPVSTAAGLAEHLQATTGPAHAVLPCGDQAMPILGTSLRAAGWTVDETVVYQTSTVTEVPASAEALAAGEFAAVVLRSPSAARALHHHVPRLPARTVLVCGGPSTAAEARRLKLPTIVQAQDHTTQGVCAAVAAAVANGEQR